jgi:hypothetical protein
MRCPLSVWSCGQYFALTKLLNASASIPRNRSVVGWVVAHLCLSAYFSLRRGSQLSRHFDRDNAWFRVRSRSSFDTPKLKAAATSARSISSPVSGVFWSALHSASVSNSPFCSHRENGALGTTVVASRLHRVRRSLWLSIVMVAIRESRMPMWVYRDFRLIPSECIQS